MSEKNSVELEGIICPFMDGRPCVMNCALSIAPIDDPDENIRCAYFAISNSLAQINKYGIDVYKQNK